MTPKVYVLNSAFQGEQIEREHLHVVYRSAHTDVVVAVKEQGWREAGCGVN